MADKKFTAKVGKDGLIDFDPVNGIMKYGSYEVFAKDVGVTPARHEITFDDYLDASRPKIGMASTMMMPRTPEQTKKLRAQFEADLASGVFGPVKTAPSMASPTGSTSYGFQEERTGFDLIAPNIKTQPTTFRNVQKLGPDTFAVDIYDFSGDQYDLVNKIGEKAQGLRYAGDDAALKQNQSDAKARRQGRASTILSTTGA